MGGARARRRAWHAYSAATATVGVGATAVAVVAHPEILSVPRLWVLLLSMLALEVLSARIARSRGYTTLSSATVFGMAALLTDGVAAGMVVFALGGLVTSVAKGRDLPKTLFNTGQLALSALAAGPLLAGARGVELLGPSGPETVTDPVAILLAVAGWFVVNLVFLSTALMLVDGLGPHDLVARVLPEHVPPIVAMLSLGPVVGIVATHALALFPLLYVPTLAVLRLVQRFIEHERAAQLDPLTGLANHRQFTGQVTTSLARSPASPSHTGVLIVDLDGFKELNDTHGHLVGDEVLRVVAQRLQGAVRSDDVVARVGGDEFGVVLANLQSPEDGEVSAAQVGACLAEEMRIGGASYTVRASVGAAVAPDGGATTDELVSGADQAMYAAKRARRAGVAAPARGVAPTTGASRPTPEPV